MINSELYKYNITDEVEAFSTMREAKVPYDVLCPHQVHEDKVAIVKSRDLTCEDLQGIDALITNLPEIAIGVKTADCVPILLFDPINKVIAAIHSGWKGTVKKISHKTINLMQEQFNINPCNLLAVIGPSIGASSFQVGEDVAQQFDKACFPMNDILTNQGERIPNSMQGGLHIDLWKANKWLLEQKGIPSSNIHIAGICTYLNNNLFFSARREGITCGRIINAIKLVKS